MEKNKEIEKIRDEFQKSIDSAENDFEKKITQISAGALALSITFIDKIVDLSTAEYFGILIFGWILLGFSLSLNLYNALFSRKLNMKSLNEFDETIVYNNKDEDIIENIKKRNNRITQIDYISFFTLIIGIFFIILFSSLNITNQNDKLKMEKKEIIQEGRTIKKPIIKPNSEKNISKSENSNKDNNDNK